MLERAYPDLVRPVKLPTHPQVHTLPGVFMETPKEERRGTGHERRINTGKVRSGARQPGGDRRNGDRRRSPPRDFEVKSLIFCAPCIEARDTSISWRKPC